MPVYLNLANCDKGLGTEEILLGTELGHFINKDGTLKDDTSLKSVDWVESYTTGIVITCQDGTTPSMADLRRVLPKEVLPYIEFAKSKERKPLQEEYKEKTSDSEESEDDEKDIQDWKFEEDSEIDEDYVASSDDETDDEEQSDSQQYEKTGSSEEDDKNIQSKLSWFEETLLNDDFELEDEQENFLASLHWVRNFYIGLSEKDNTLQLFITCEKDEVPCMAELKKEFGEDIVYFVEFIPGTDAVFEYLVDGNNYNNTSSTTKPHHMGAPMSGDAIYNVKDSPENYGSLGIFIAESADGTKTHFATTCYHVCYCGKKLPANLEKRHQKFIEDSNKTKSSTHKARHYYRCRGEETGNEKKQDEGERNNSRLEQERQQAVETEGNSSGFSDDKVDVDEINVEEINVVGENGENERGRVREVQGKENISKDNLKIKPDETINDEEMKIEEEQREKEEGEEQREEGEEKRESGATNENKGCMLGTFLWGVYNERHDISLIKLRQKLNCSCTMNDITCSELPSKKDIVGIFKKCKGEVKVEKTGFSTGTTEGIFCGFNFCELKKGGRELRKGYIIKNKDDSRPFSAPGDSGAQVKLVPPNNGKIPFSYIVHLVTTGQTFCLNLRSSLNEYKHFKKGHMKACLGSCAAATSR